MARVYGITPDARSRMTLPQFEELVKDYRQWQEAQRGN